MKVVKVPQKCTLNSIFCVCVGEGGLFMTKVTCNMDTTALL